MPQEQRAWTWQGSPEPLALVLKQRPLEPAPAHHVRVRNAVIGLNPVDWKVLDGKLSPLKPGQIPGVDASGTVEEIGQGVDPHWQGQRVTFHCSLQDDGSFAEYTTVPARALLRLPSEMDFETAASFPCPALTAWLAINKLPVGARNPLLISGAGGAVGQYLVQLATARGFVISAMAHPRHHEHLQTLGAKECLPGPLADDQAWSGERRFFAVIDTVGGDHAARLAESLRANGHLVCVQDRVSGWLCPPFTRTLSMHEVALGALHIWGDDDDWAQLVAAGERMLAEIIAGRLQPETRLVRDFEDLPQFLDELRHRSFSGKAVVRVRPK